MPAPVHGGGGGRAMSAAARQLPVSVHGGGDGGAAAVAAAVAVCQGSATAGHWCPAIAREEMSRHREHSEGTLELRGTGQDASQNRKAAHELKRSN